MKRSGPLKRTTPLKPTRMKRNRRRGDKPNDRLAYLELHSNCGVCHAGWREFDNWLEVHHLCAGPGRKDVRGNFLTLCRKCHDEYHRGKNLTPGMLLTAKREQDPEGYDKSVICELLGRKQLPDRWVPVPLPEWVYQERERNCK